MKPPASLARWIDPTEHELLWFSTASPPLLPRLPVRWSHLRWVWVGSVMLSLGSFAGALWADGAGMSSALQAGIATLSGMIAAGLGLCVAVEALGPRTCYALLAARDGRRVGLVALVRGRALRFPIERAPQVGPSDPADVDWGVVETEELPRGTRRRCRVRWHSIRGAKQLADFAAAPG